MILTLVALISLFALWALATQGTVRRRWKGDEARHFNTEWELKADKSYVYFAIPSFKSAYFEMRPGNFLSRFMSNFASFAPTRLEKRLRVLTEEPHLTHVLSRKMELIDALLSLQDYADFQILSNGQELHGWLKFKGKASEGPMERAEFQRALHALAGLLEVQFDLPLNEMKPEEIASWRRSASLPVAMAGSAILVWLLDTFVLPENLIFQPTSSKVWIGLSLFATGLGLFWGAMRVPPHYFLRVALSFVLLFSWSSFLWIYGVFTALNPIVSTGRISLQCRLQIQSSVTQSHYDCHLIDQQRIVSLPSHFMKMEWLKPGVDTQLEVAGRTGLFGQVFADSVSLSSNQRLKEIVGGTKVITPSEELPVSTEAEISHTDSAENENADILSGAEAEGLKQAPIDVNEHMGLDLGRDAGLPGNSEDFGD